jgi:hypothetical protein
MIGEDGMIVWASVERIRGISYLGDSEVFKPLGRPMITDTGCIILGHLDLERISQRSLVRGLNIYVEIYGVQEGVDRFELNHGVNSSTLLESVV